MKCLIQKQLQSVKEDKNEGTVLNRGRKGFLLMSIQNLRFEDESIFKEV